MLRLVLLTALFIFFNGASVSAQSTSSEASESATLATNSASNQSYQQERALKNAYLDSFNRYSTLETNFNDIRSKYRRLGDQSLLPPLIEAARKLYQARDEMYINYLNWIEYLVQNFAADGELIEVSYSGGSLKPINLNQVASDVATLNERSDVKIQTLSEKKKFISDIVNLREQFQTHRLLAEKITDINSWQDFHENTFDPQTVLSGILYQIFSFTILNQVEIANQKITDAFTNLKPQILKKSETADIDKVEAVKLLNQIQLVRDDLDKEVKALRTIEEKVQSLNSYQGFLKSVTEISTNIAQINNSLATLLQ